MDEMKTIKIMTAEESSGKIDWSGNSVLLLKTPGSLFKRIEFKENILWVDFLLYVTDSKGTERRFRLNLEELNEQGTRLKCSVCDRTFV